MIDDPSEPMPPHPAATPALQAALRALASPETFSRLDDQSRYSLDTVWTEFLRHSIPHAKTDRAQRRIRALRQMEQLIARQEAGYAIGMQGFLLGSIARVGLVFGTGAEVDIFTANSALLHMSSTPAEIVSDAAATADPVTRRRRMGRKAGQRGLRRHGGLICRSPD